MNKVCFSVVFIPNGRCAQADGADLPHRGLRYGRGGLGGGGEAGRQYEGFGGQVGGTVELTQGTFIRCLRGLSDVPGVGLVGNACAAVRLWLRVMAVQCAEQECRHKDCQQCPGCDMSPMTMGHCYVLCVSRVISEGCPALYAMCVQEGGHLLLEGLGGLGGGLGEAG